MLTFMQAVKRCVIEKPLNIKDRAPRSEYWWFMLALFIGGLVANILAIIPILGWLIMIVFNIGSFVLSITANVRRLHDRDHSGWWILAPYGCLVAGGLLFGLGVAAGSDFISMLAVLVLGGFFVCFVVLLIFMVMPGTPGPNRFGPDPLAAYTQPQPLHFEADPAQPADPASGQNNQPNGPQQ